ncbi:hypothetical protein IWQ47_003333 [Aquimarina sp. EL_43]|uniref:hypothetical protein n=1 Tax=unclassified Aquimarina TaxID=2627091 RepID=UPI001A1995D5|nr:MULTISPECIES: hypothetical protein [unclassified Aquimarina]MBG6131925.1 hypothetical protein [Aquimarina sp. EL_35]MBG6149489.1 hypothetical protein [Aquimarina sp. EL_32]MBG6170248.1 hypothetical protein [Aquimarina sp. EL_43]
MGKIAKIYLSIIFVLFIAFMVAVIQTFRPVRNVQPDDVMKIEGIVTNIQEGSGFDIVITLKNDKHHYYINRGLQYQLTVEQLRSDILNKRVTLYGIERWTIFTRDKNMGHISKLIIDDIVIFNEIDNDEHEKTI